MSFGLAGWIATVLGSLSVSGIIASRYGFIFLLRAPIVGLV